MFNKHFKKITRTSQKNFNRENYLRLERNERVLPFSNKTLIDVRKLVNNNNLQSYATDQNAVLNLISKREKINTKYINMVPGADSAIKSIFEVFSKSKSKFVTIYPTYGMVQIYSYIYKIQMNKVYESDIEKFLLNETYKKISFLYIANPNQPSGSYFNKKLILKIIKKAKSQKKYIIIDEAYIDFANERSISQLVKKFDNLIVIKSFSKFIGLAGLRVGYFLSHPKIGKIINSVRANYDISHFSLKVVEYFLKNKKILNDYILQINKSKKYIAKECLKRKLKFLNTKANFFHIFLKPKKIKEVFEFLRKNKILIRSRYFGDLNLLNNSIRVTIGSKKQMSYFFKQFDKVYFN